MKTLLIQVSPLDPATGARMTVNIGDGPAGASFGIGNIAWQPAVKQRPQGSLDLFSPDLDGTVQTGTMSMVLALRNVASPQGSHLLYWLGAPITIMSTIDYDLAGAVIEFNGYLTSALLDEDDLTLKIEASVSTALIEKPLLIGSFSGSGGLGGDASKRGVLYPAGYGSVGGIQPVWFDQTRNIGMIDGYGNCTAISRLLEGLSTLGASQGDYPSYAALASAIDNKTIKPGQWATSIANGLIGLGAPPAGIVTVDATFVANRPGAMMLRWMTQIGVLSSKIDMAAFNALDAAVPYPVHYWTAQQINVSDLMSQMCASVNASPIVSFQGLVTVTRAVLKAAPDATLDRSGQVTPRVLGFTAQDTDPPFYQLTARAARPASVLTTDQVNYGVEINDRGGFNPTTIYSNGDLVWLPNGASYLYVNATPLAGQSVFDTNYFSPQQPATIVDFTSQVTGQAKADLIAQAANAAAAASTALMQLGIIASDGYLTAGQEKRDLIQYVQTILNEKPLLDAQADALSVSHTTYDNAYSALVAYLTSLSPAWNDTTQTTAIVASTFNGKFTDYEYALVALDNAMTQTNANSAALALAQIATIASDGYLSRNEKPAIITDWVAINNAVPGLVAQAAKLNVDSTALTNAKTALDQYLTSLSPPWNDPTQDTPIVGATFMGKFEDYYTAASALGNALTNASAQTAPAANRVTLSLYERGTIGWAIRFNSSGLAIPVFATAVLSSTGQSYLQLQATATASGQTVSMGTDNAYSFTVTPGEYLSVAAGLQVSGANGVFKLTFYKSDGSVLSSSTVWSGGTLAAFSRQFCPPILVPASAAKASLDLAGISTGSGTIVIGITQAMVCSVLSAQSAAPPFVAGPNSLPGADQTGLNTALDTTKVNGQLSSDVTAAVAAANTAAGNAQTTANQANAFANDVADNSKFSKDEKKRYQGLINGWVSSVPAQVTQLNSLGLLGAGATLTASWSGANGFLPYLQSLNYNDLGSSSSIDRNTFRAKEKAFSDAETAASNALANYASVVSTHNTANIFQDPRFERIADTSAWSNFSSAIVVQASVDGQRIVFQTGIGAQNAYAAPIVMGPNDRLDFECEVFIQNITNNPVFGCYFDLIDGNGSYIGTGGVTRTIAGIASGWQVFRGSFTPAQIGGNWANTAIATPHLYCDNVTGGNLYIRNPRGYRVVGATQNLTASGRGTSSLLVPTNLIAGIRSLNLTGFALSQTNAGSTVTVNATQSQYRLDTGLTLTYPSASFTGLAYSTTYYFWRADPNLDSGSAYGVSTNLTDALAPGNVYLGYITTMSSAGIGGGGGGGGSTGCVDPEMFVEIEGRGPIRAVDALAGERLLCLTEDMLGLEFVPIESNDIHQNLKCTISTETGEALTLAINTPVPHQNGSYGMAANCATSPIPVRDGDAPAWVDATVEAARFGPVSAIRCGQRVYGAGREPGRYIFTHNPVSKP